MSQYLQAGVDATQDTRYDKAFYHSPGGITSALGSSHQLWMPRPGSGGSLLNSQAYEPMKETLIGSLTIHCLRITHEQSEQKGQHHLRLGCQLPVGAQGGRFPRHQTRCLDIRGDSVVWNERTEVAILQYQDPRSGEVLFPRLTFSLRAKGTGWFGRSGTVSQITTLALSSFWEGPESEWSAHLVVPLRQAKTGADAWHLHVALQYQPVSEKTHARMEELERAMALKATYTSKMALTVCTPEQVEELIATMDRKSPTVLSYGEGPAPQAS